MLATSLIAVEYISYRLTSDQIVKMTEQQQAAITSIYAERISHTISVLESDLMVLATTPSLGDYHRNRDYHLLEEANEDLKTSIKVFRELIERTPGYLRLQFLYKNGNTLIDLDAHGNNITNHSTPTPFYLLKRRAGTSFVGLIPAPGSVPEGASIIFRSEVLSQNRSVIGTIEAQFSLDKVLERLKKEKVFESGYLSVISSKGDVIYFPEKKPMDSVLLIHPHFQELINKMRAAPFGKFSLDLDTSYEVGFTEIPNLQWFVVSFAPKKEMFATLNQIKHIVLFIVMINIMVEILFLAYFVQRVVLSPVNAILEVTRRILLGDLSARVVVKSSDEIGALAHSFNRMTKSLEMSLRETRELNATLDAKIEEGMLHLKHAQSQLIESSKMAALGEMAGGVAHEINNPLAIIESNSRLLEKLIDTGNLSGLLARVQTIRKTVTRIEKIVNSLQSFSRDGSDDPFVLSSVKDIINDSLSLCLERFTQAGVKLEFENPKTDINVRCRAHQISQVLLNLLNNAFDAISTLPEKWIHIAVEDRRDLVSIRVTDCGNGIPEPILSKIFQPFFTTKEIGKGTGIGLSISKGIIEAHNGSLIVNRDSKNTQFEIILKRDS